MEAWRTIAKTANIHRRSSSNIVIASDSDALDDSLSDSYEINLKIYRKHT